MLYLGNSNIFEKNRFYIVSNMVIILADKGKQLFFFEGGGSVIDCIVRESTLPK